jgi:hypothetical protein
MNIKNFKAGKYVKQIEYSSFLPEKISKEWTISSPKINSLFYRIINTQLMPK